MLTSPAAGCVDGGGMERGDKVFSHADAASVLQWWSDAGVDVMIDETPHDWLRARPETAVAAPVVAEERMAAPEPASTPAPAPAAREPEPALPDQLPLFRAWLAENDRVPLAAPSVPRVCPSGDPASGLIILADMPSGEDCASGTLISGEAGRLFDRMLAAIGRSRETVYLAALSCLRSPDGRLSTEIARSCAELARHHVGLVQPKALLLLGDSVSKALLGLPMAQSRGRWHEIPVYGGTVRAMVTLPPAYLLGQSAHKALAWGDLQMLLDEVK
jgi:uracil-DNA glycosylase family 4